MQLFSPGMRDIATAPHVTFHAPVEDSRQATMLLGVNSIAMWCKLVNYLNVFPEVRPRHNSSLFSSADAPRHKL